MGQMLPGVRSGSTLGDFNFVVGGGVPYQIHGARTQDTLVTFDGAPAVRTRGSGAIIGVASVDATEEMQVMTAGYQAEYGGAAGGQVRIVTKSGTRGLHGSAYEYLRNSAMNANTWSRNLSPSTRFASPFRYNNFGFTFGGPIWEPWLRRDKNPEVGAGYAFMTFGGVCGLRRIPGVHGIEPLRQKSLRCPAAHGGMMLFG